MPMADTQEENNYTLGSDELKVDICIEPCCKHENEVIKYHCQNHDKLGCSVCIVLDHKTCDAVHYIPEVAKDLLNNLTFLDIDTRLQRAHQKSTKIVKHATQITTNLENSSVTAIEDFKKFKNELIEALTNIEAGLEKEAKAIKQKELETLSKILDNSKQNQNTLQNVTDKVEQLKSENQNCNLYTYIVKSRNLLKPIEDQVYAIDTFLSDRRSKIKFRPNYGIFDALNTPAVLCKIALEHEPIERAKHVKDISIKMKKDKRNILIGGCAMLPNNNLVVADINNKNLKSVDLLDEQVKLYAKLPSEPWDIALIDDKQLAVTLPSNRQIRFLSLTDVPNVERCMDVDGECYGVDYRDNKMAVSYINPCKVEVLSLTGTVLHSITNNESLSNEPRYIALSQDTKSLYVTKYLRNEVVCLKLDGTLKATYTDAELQGPRKVITDRSGTVLICTRGAESVHQLSSDLNKIKILLSADDGLVLPCALFYNDKRGDMYICGATDTLRVYKVIYQQPE